MSWSSTNEKSPVMRPGFQYAARGRCGNVYCRDQVSPLQTIPPSTQPFNVSPPPV